MRQFASNPGLLSCRRAIRGIYVQFVVWRTYQQQTPLSAAVHADFITFPPKISSWASSAVDKLDLCPEIVSRVSVCLAQAKGAISALSRRPKIELGAQLDFRGKPWEWGAFRTFSKDLCFIERNYILTVYFQAFGSPFCCLAWKDRHDWGELTVCWDDLVYQQLGHGGGYSTWGGLTWTTTQSQISAADSLWPVIT